MTGNKVCPETIVKLDSEQVDSDNIGGADDCMGAAEIPPTQEEDKQDIAVKEGCSGDEINKLGVPIEPCSSETCSSQGEAVNSTDNSSSTIM